MYAINNNFQYRTLTSNKESLHVICKDERCKWTVRAVRLTRVNMFQIRRFRPTHTCLVDYRQGNHRQATADIIADMVAYKYLDASETPYTPKQLRNDVALQFGISMSYKKAWKAQKLAKEKQFGSDAASYQLLPSMAHMLKQSYSKQTCNNHKLYNKINLKLNDLLLPQHRFFAGHVLAFLQFYHYS
ncbi:unnamed protein product [Cuscuta epithymum]|uniref:Transposase MuDR plant domain-containing protein n=1 Tax=Cuscuta epithymum TaxID=186058 RepID=A0AAV0G3I1_9ASTE|nr:unnamed protein product [Cuscuta epithymum]